VLILTRKKDEKIIINDNITITIVELDNNQVKLGIEAPEWIEVHREEIYRQIEEENRRAVVKKDFELDNLLQIDTKKD
jgi:carbon storage regulator